MPYHFYRWWLYGSSEILAAVPFSLLSADSFRHTYLPKVPCSKGEGHKNSEQTKNRRGPEWNFLIFSLHFYLPNNAN